MLRHIERLRTKPKSVRIQVAFVTAVLLTAVVSAVWFVSVPSQLADMQAAVLNQNTESDPGRTYWQKLQIAFGIRSFATPDAAPAATSSEATDSTADATAQVVDEVIDDSYRAPASSSRSGPGRVILVATTSAASATVPAVSSD